MARMLVGALALAVESLPVASAQIIGDEGPSQLNVLFMVESISIYVVVLGIFFFWNRILGLIVGFCLRQYMWKTSDAHISIGSLQISPLAGRILFKDVRYHSTNMSTRVLLGHITWRYWKWRIRKEDSNETSPCRCQIHLEGLEWFLYNRTPSFDAIVERMQDAERRERNTDPSAKDASMDGSSVDHSSETAEVAGENETIGTSGRRSTQRSEPAEPDEPLHRPLSPPVPNLVGNIAGNVRDSHGNKNEKLPWQWQRDVFPFGIDISHGAVVVGNDATPTVTIAEFSTAEGVVRTEESRSRFDLFKQVVDMQFTDIQVLYRTNPDFTGGLLDHGKKVYEQVMKMEPELANAPSSSLITRPAFKALATKYRSLASQYSAKLQSYALSYYGPEKEWKGLARYRDDTDIAAALKGKEVEYAKVTTLMSTRKIDMTYFADVAGLVPEPWERADEDGNIPEDDDFELGNGDLPPQWGMDFVVYSGTMTYGPWADRQRTAFNQAFLPSIFYHTPQTERLKPGDFRKHVAMNIEVEIREATVWRMPTRESSKDWLYDKANLPKKSAGATRKYGWLDVSIGPSSAVHYTVPLTATKFGFEAELQLELANIKVTSSVNHTEFLSARHCLVNASMPTPLQWDARRDWTFDVNLDQVRTFLLRDHTTLIGDLAKDWNSGPTGDFDHFVPMDYQFNFSLTNFEIKLYLNDFNIINQPLTLDENAFLNICGPKIAGQVEVPLIRYRPESSTIPFSINGENMVFTMDLPRWQTHNQNSFGNDRLHNLGKLQDLHLRGSYLYFSEVHPDNVEALTLTINLKRINFRAFGWAIRRLMILKENYFGGFNSWTNMAEFRKKYEATIPSWGDAVVQKYRPGKSDKFEVNLDLRCEDGKVILPEDIYDCDSAIILPIPYLQVHLRSHESLMQVCIDLGPTRAWYTPHSDRDFAEVGEDRRFQKHALHLNGISIRGNRLFGNPPLNSTYLCLWEIALEDVTGSLDVTLIKGMMRALQAFKYNYNDMENAPLWLYAPPVDPDVTLLKLSLGSLSLSLPVQDYICQVGAAQISLATNDLASSEYAKLLSLSVPSLVIRMLRCTKVQHDRAKRSDRIAYISAALYLDRHAAPAGWKQRRMKQQRYIRAEDARSRRCGPLYGEEAPTEPFYNGVLYCPSPFDPVFSASAEGYLSDDTVSTDWSTDDDHCSSAEEGADVWRGPALRKRRSLKSKLRAPHILFNVESSDATPRSSSDSKHGAVQSTGDEENYALMTISTGQIVDAEITPGILGAVVAYQAVFQDNDLTISQVLDDLLVDQAGRIRSARNTELRSTDQFLVHIPAVRLRLQQSCPPSARTGIATSVASDTAVDIRLETLSMRVHKVEQVIATDRFSVIQLFNAKLGNLTVRGEQDLTKTSVHLGNSEGFRRPQADLDDNLRFDLRISNFEVQKSHPLEGDGRSVVSVGDIIIHTGSLGPALLCVIVMSWRASIAGLTRMPGNSSKSAIAQLAISQIVRGIRSVQDPQCLTSRFELLRHKKIPYITASLMADVDVAAREDPGWLALTLLRVVMQKRELNQHKINANLPVPPDIEAILEENIQTISGWRKQHLSRESIARVPFLRLQNSESSSASSLESGSSRIDSAFVTELHIQMDDQRQGSKVELFVLNLQNINASHVENAEQPSRHPSGRAAHCGMKTCKIRSHIYLLDRLQDLAPTLLFTRKALQSKQESENPPSLMLEASNPESPRPYSAALQIQEMEFSVLATPLQVDMRVLDLQCLLSKNTARLSVTPDIANLNTTKTRVRLISLTSKHDKPSPQVALVVLELDKTRLSLCDVNHKAHPAPQRASIIVNAHHVLVHTRATPHLMHARIQEWLDSYKSKYMNTLEGLHDLFEKEAGPTLDGDKASGESTIKNIPVGRIAIVADGCAFNVRISKEVTAFWTVAKSEVRLLAVDLTKRDGFHLQSSLTLGEQAIGFSKTSLAISNVADAPSIDDVLLKMPVISLKADAEFSRCLIRIQGDLCIHHFTGTLKPKTFDRVLAMYRTIGSDIKAIGRLLSKARGPPVIRTDQLEREKALRKQQQRFIIDLTYEIKGVHLSLKAADVVSTLLIQSGRVYGKFARDTDVIGESWSAHLDCLELSLGHAQEPLGDASSLPSRAIQSAHLLCSFAIEQKPRIENTSKHGKRPTAIVDTTIQRVHAVMHVSALEEMYDLLNSWSRDLKTLAERRKREWEEIKESTRELIRADVKTGEAEAIGWMESAILTVVVSSFAVAIPLHAESVLNKRRHSSLPAALLFTIRRLDLVNRKGESGRTGIQDMYLQYVDSFDSHDDRHYDGQFHLSNNRMHLPEAQLQFRLENLPSNRSLKVSSIFKGFELRLDRHVGRYVKETLVVYSRGKEQIGQLYRAYAVEPELGSPNPEVNDSRPLGRLLVVQTSAEFVSGKVLLIKGADNHTGRRSTHTSTSDVQEQLKAGTLAESISLPGLSLWVDFAEGTEISPGTCRISTIVQRSENILKPSILQFVESATEPISTTADVSPHTVTSNSLPTFDSEESAFRSEPTEEAGISTVNQAVPAALAGFTAKTRLIFSLRIDKSRLALSCEPDNQVVANLAWDSGGFNLQCKPKAESITATLQVSSVSFHLSREIYQTRHTFVSGALADLTATFVLREGSVLPILQAMIYTKVSADLNIKLLRQWFAFNSVWIARLSPIARAIPTEDSDTVKLPARPLCTPQQGHTSHFRRTSPLGKIGRHVVVGLRLHQVSLRANLDVSNVDIDIPLIDGRLAANDTLQRLLVDLGGLKMIGTHTVSGKIISDGMRFVAERKRILENSSYVTVMKLRIDAQDTLAELACIDQHVLGLHIYPTVVELHDDCLFGLEEGTSCTRKMGLAFKINLGQVDMMFAMLSLNALLDESHTFLRRIDDEKTEAEHGSAAYRHYLATKPKNAIAAVAETMQKSRLTEMPAGATDLRIEQRLVLVTQPANLAIQATNEEKIYVFRFTPVHAKYRKTGHARHLEAEVESVRLSRDRPKDTTMLKDMKSVGEWLHNKTGVTREELVSLPFITINMDSVENEISQLLDYDFDINYHNQKIKIALTMQAIRDAQEAYSIAKQIRAGKMDRDASAEANGEGVRSNLIMRPRKVNLKPPPADYLGSTTDEMLRLLKYDQAFQQAPHASHLVQTKLDMIMDMLLTIYNKLECSLP